MKTLTTICCLALFGGLACDDWDDATSAPSRRPSLQPTSHPIVETRHEVEAERAIRGCFEAYKSAALREDGELAARYVSEASLDYFQRIMDQVRTLPKDDAIKLPLLDRFLVLSYRHTLSTEQAMSFSGRDALIHSINNGWAGANNVWMDRLRDVRVEGRLASAGVIVDDEETTYRHQFRELNGTWKLDLEPIMKVANTRLEELARWQHTPTDQWLTHMIRVHSGGRVDESIWEPIVTQD